MKQINIGGVPYSNYCDYNGFPAEILAYDINTEAHLVIEQFGERKRIELDNANLKLTEVK